ncbi:dTDP-4-dehydrorhamnose 3,5-epimerase [Anaerorhabdus furcosa]|uniref:dTDP-4-dehydrorhamnose 3,5-epimerase n=1 Tax=Anaerorhabdus furcosa TaxID=118967 RepID=A0A1T4NZ38_9FIRM|nr:dTDP-4-dehydrorhamnose 3,5-epimerase [Anaerorhabdus furcosa]SJZ84481.1 dTDP-4-dehydrorhamnose 3,5-epimerase [Anaerorhabdus furcosa]
MEIIKTCFEGVLIIKPNSFVDNRGFFMETYQKDRYSELGICYTFVQSNLSSSYKKGTIRGIHWQNEPYAQTKLVQCIKGEIKDIVVDLRRNSQTFGEWISIDLSESNRTQVLIPDGFGHAFISLVDDVIIEYKVNNNYCKECERTIRYDDPTIKIDWNSFLEDFTPILSEKDMNASFLNESDIDFDRV